MPTTPEQIAELISGYTDLKQYFENSRESIEQRVAAKEDEVDNFLQSATPETRYIQDITIGGSTDYFYPVWFRFPSNVAGTSKLCISRRYSWNGGESERPLDPSRAHQAALLLELEGNDASWGGDANFLEIKRFSERYNLTVSHVGFSGYSKWEATGEREDYVSPADTWGANGRTFSTVFLRGGGLTYRIIKNWVGDVSYSDAESRTNVYVNSTYGTWYVEPIPLADRIAPLQTKNAFVDPE